MSEINEVSLEHVFQFILAAAFGAWAWVVKVAAHRHLEGQDRIETKLSKIEHRITILETKMRIHHESEDE